MTASRAKLLKQYKDTDKLQSNPVNMDSSENRGGWGGVLRGSKEVSVLGGLNIGKMQGLSFTRGNATGP